MVREVDKPEVLILETTCGTIVIELFPDIAPLHVARIKELADEGAYNGVIFHRVIEGFMAQTGDVKYGRETSPNFDKLRAGRGGSDKPDLPAEFSARPHKRGTASMARSSDPNSANSQFFLCFGDLPFLDGHYSVWGQIIEGIDNIDKIAFGEPPNEPDMIIRAYVPRSVSLN